MVNSHTENLVPGVGLVKRNGRANRSMDERRVDVLFIVNVGCGSSQCGIWEESSNFVGEFLLLSPSLQAQDIHSERKLMGEKVFC